MTTDDRRTDTPRAHATSRRCSMSPRVRCPRCGGDHVQQQTVRLHASSGVPRPAGWQRWLYVGGGLVLLVGIVLMVLSVLPRLLPQAGGQARPLVAGVAGTGALLVLGGAMLFVSASVQAHRAAAATTFLHHYACLFHDFQWIWREDE